jgi:signal peptidase I
MAIDDPTSPFSTEPTGPAAPPGSGAPNVPNAPNGSHQSHQSAHSAAEDQLAESFALDDAVRPGGPPPAWGAPAESAAPGQSGERADQRNYEAISARAAMAGAGGGTGAPPPRSGWRRRRGVEKTRRKAPWWELPLLIAVAVVVAMLIKTFLVQPYYIPSESMENTLYGCAGCSGDRILVNKPIYDLRDPHPGDIIVFKSPSENWDNEPTPQSPSNPVLKAVHWVGELVGLVPPDENDLVKRVIAVGGQTVKCCDTNGNVEVSDTGPGGPFRSLNEPYIYQNLPFVANTTPGDANTQNQTDQRTFGPVTVPKGRLWVMGDHRSVSEDSRWHYTHDSLGDATNSTVPVSDVIGKAVLIVWPPSRWTTLGTPGTFTTAAVAIGGPVAPILGSAALVLPVWVGRRSRRRRPSLTRRSPL